MILSSLLLKHVAQHRLPWELWLSGMGKEGCERMICLLLLCATSLISGCGVGRWKGSATPPFPEEVLDPGSFSLSWTIGGQKDPQWAAVQHQAATASCQGISAPCKHPFRPPAGCLTPHFPGTSASAPSLWRSLLMCSSPALPLCLASSISWGLWAQEASISCAFREMRTCL